MKPSGLFRPISLLLVFFLWRGVFPVQAQNGSIQGQVVDLVTQSPLPGVNVVVVGTDRGAPTDASGRFVIDGIQPGTWTVQATYLGFQPQTLSDIVVQPSRPTLVRFELAETPVELGGVTVESSLFERSPDAPTSIKVLGAEEIRRTPGGQNDISRSLLSLPGVVGGVDNRNDFVVRGGGPSENAYFVDGIPVPQINHFATQGAAGGALGLLNIDLIRDTRFYTGGFPARYGDALSSVLIVNNRPGTPDGIAGDFTVGAVETALTIDGSTGEKANWAFSARRSYLQLLFTLLDLPIRPNYWDFQTRIEYDPDDRNQFTLVGLGAIDDFKIVTPDDPDYEQQEIINRVLDNDQKSYTGGLTWRRLVPGGVLHAAISRSLTDFTFSDLDADEQPVLTNRSTEAENHLRLDADFRLNSTLTLGTGAGVTLATIETNFFQRARPGTTFTETLSFADKLDLWRSFGYGQLGARAWKGRLQATLGFRADVTSFLERSLYVSPRFSSSLQVFPHWTLNLSTGVFYQSPEYISLIVRDSLGRYVNDGLPYIRADHLVLGVAWQARPSLQISLEGYYKRYGDYPVSRDDPRISLANLGGAYGTVGAEPLRGVGKGRAYGLELSAQKKLVERFYGLGSYTLAWSEFSGTDGVYRPSSWDVRHSVSLGTGYRLGRSWEFGLRWRYLSGRPYTPFDPVLSPAEYALTGNGVPDYDRLNALRTPAYHRLDIRIDRRFSLRNWNAVVYLDLQNVFNRTNLFGYEYTENPEYPDNRRPVDNIGFLPNVGFSIEW